MGLSFNKAERATARMFVDIAIRQTVAKSRCRARIALKKTNCGGRDVYLTSTVAEDLPLPFLSSSNGCRRQRRRLRITQVGSRNVANAVGV